MHVHVVEFPPMVEGRDADFREWPPLTDAPRPHSHTVVSTTDRAVPAA